MFISKPHTRARQSSAISDHFPSQAHGGNQQIFGAKQQVPHGGQSYQEQESSSRILSMKTLSSLSST